MYTIKANPLATEYDYKPRGGCDTFFYCHDHEAIIHGPAETGKTLAACWKAHLLASGRRGKGEDGGGQGRAGLPGCDSAEGVRGYAGKCMTDFRACDKRSAGGSLRQGTS